MDLESLLTDPPKLHRERGGAVVSWGVSPDLIRELDRRLSPGARTLETGAGLSTLFFALKGAQHIAVAPDAALMDRIRQWCAGHGIPADGLRLLAEPSERCLPALECEPLDLALIDGRHGFPAPFIDWYYIEPHLKIGGALVVDDTQLWTGAVLRDFLRSDSAWEDLGEWSGKTSLFRKVANGSAGREWVDQRYVVTRSRRLQRGARWRVGLGHLVRGEWSILLKKWRSRRRD
jgi:hypothetical protein